MPLATACPSRFALLPFRLHHPLVAHPGTAFFLQNAGMMGYPPQPQQAYPPVGGMPAPGMGYAPMGMNAPSMMPPVGAPGPMMQQGGFNEEDPYAFAQQYGLTRGEVDGALEAYTELNNTDRGLLSAFGTGGAQKILQKVFGSAGNDQMIAVLVGVLGQALASGRVPFRSVFSFAFVLKF